MNKKQDRVALWVAKVIFYFLDFKRVLSSVLTNFKGRLYKQKDLKFNILPLKETSKASIAEPQTEMSAGKLKSN